MKTKSLALLTLTTLAAFSGAAEAKIKRYVVLGTDLATLKASVAAEGGNIENDLVNFSGFASTLDENAVARLRSKLGSKIFIEEDFEVHTVPGSESIEVKGGANKPQPAEVTPWGITDIKADLAQAVNTGTGAIVCVVDTGIQSNHADLAANIIGGENFVAKKNGVNPAAWNDDNGHGTHVSGTIAALDNDIGVVGVAPTASLFAVKVLNKNGSGFSSAVADGIVSCVDNGGADIISMSLGSPVSSTLIEDAVTYAAGQGALIIAAAGNDGANAVSYPAAYPEVIAVSAVDASHQLAVFSNFGPEIAFAAPGVGVFSTFKGNAYATLDGTSMATPHVSGVAALMIANGGLGLLATDIGLASDFQGAGLIDALATVNNVAP